MLKVFQSLATDIDFTRPCVQPVVIRDGFDFVFFIFFSCSPSAKLIAENESVLRSVFISGASGFRHNNHHLQDKTPSSPIHYFRIAELGSVFTALPPHPIPLALLAVFSFHAQLLNQSPLGNADQDGSDYGHRGPGEPRSGIASYCIITGPHKSNQYHHRRLSRRNRNGSHRCVRP